MYIQRAYEILDFLANVFGMLAMVTYKIFFSQNNDFPYNIYKSVANTNSKQQILLMDGNEEKPGIQPL